MAACDNEREEREYTLDTQASKFQNNRAFAVDFGSSQIKVVYAEPKGANQGTLNIHFLTYSNNAVDEVIKFLANKFDGIKKEIVHFTGVGLTQESKGKIEAALDVSVKPLMEFDCTVDGFNFLTKNYPLRHLIHKCPLEAREFARRVRNQLVYSDRVVAEGGKSVILPLYQPDDCQLPPDDDQDEETIQYPALVFMLGSGIQTFKIHADGRQSRACVFNSGGRALLALGSLIAGAETGDELLDLASRGCSRNIDVTLSDCTKSSQETYSGITGDDFITFNMGKAIGKETGDFSREDLAAGCVSLMTGILGAFTQMTSAAHDAKQAFFCGGIACSSHLLREEVWKHFNVGRLTNALSVDTKPCFMKHGAYLAGLGALLKNLQMK